MRLRQIALASYGLDIVVAQLAAVFGLKVAYNDPQVGHYGLKNAVLPSGTGFLEVVEPIADGASAGRFLQRRGGDAGYMIILQTADAEAQRRRLVDLGVRVVDDIDSRDYRCSHFHPADFGGVLTSFDQQRTEADFLAPYGDWMPAGPDWRQARTDEVTDLVSVTLSNRNPEALAQRWSELLGLPLDGQTLCLARGAVHFVAGDDPATLISSVELKVRDRPATLARAQAAGLDLAAGGVLISGVRFAPVA